MIEHGGFRVLILGSLQKAPCRTWIFIPFLLVSSDYETQNTHSKAKRQLSTHIHHTLHTGEHGKSKPAKHKGTVPLHFRRNPQPTNSDQKG